MTVVINGSGTITGISAGGLPSGTVTQTTLATPVVGNGPVFSAVRSGGSGSNVNITTATWTKISFNGVDFDTNNIVNTSNGTITPTVAGYYQITCSMFMNYTSSALVRMGIRLYKNGSAFKGDVVTGASLLYGMYTMSAVVYCNGSTDYLEMYAFQQASTDAQVLASGLYTYMTGALVRAA